MVELEKVKSLFKNINVIIEKYKEKDKDKYENLFFAYQVSNNTFKNYILYGRLYRTSILIY